MILYTQHFKRICRTVLLSLWMGTCLFRKSTQCSCRCEKPLRVIFGKNGVDEKEY